MTATLALLAAIAAPLVVQGGRVHTMDGAVYDPGTVVIDEGVIQAVGPMNATAAPVGARILNATGAHVLPGFIVAGSPLGLTEIGAVKVTNDTDEVSAPSWPQLLVTDAFHAESELLPVARLNGITHALVEPGDSNPIAGRSAVFRLAGTDGHSMVVRSPVALHLNLGEPPMNKFRGAKKAPSTRMGAAALIRQAFIGAREYGEALARHRVKRQAWEEGKVDKEGKVSPPREAGKEPDPPAVDLAKQALLDALRGELPVVFRAKRRDDILTVLRLSKEMGLRAILSHGAEAWRVADSLAAAKIPVLMGPIREGPSQMENLHANYESAARLHAAGVPLAFRNGWAHDVRNLPYHAAIAVSYGLPREVALHALTAGAADILGVGDRIGRLKPGFEASLQVVRGDPLEIRADVRHVIIAGEELPLTSRHTRLRDRYNTPR